MRKDKIFPAMLRGSLIAEAHPLTSSHPHGKKNIFQTIPQTFFCLLVIYL